MGASQRHEYFTEDANTIHSGLRSGLHEVLYKDALFAAVVSFIHAHS